MSSGEGQLPEPPSGSGLFQISLASTELHAYLKRLATAINTQSEAQTKMMLELESLRKEFTTLSRNTCRVNEENTAKVQNVQSSMAATVNQSQLRSSAALLQKQIDAMGKLLEVKFDDDGEITESQSDLRPKAAHIEEPPLKAAESRPPQKSEDHAIHEQKTTQTTESKNQVRSISMASPNSLPSTGGGTLPSDNSNQVAPGLRSLFEKYLQEWYRARGLVDAKIRHEITSASFRAAISDLGAEMRNEMRTLGSELVSLTFFHESQDTLKSEVARTLSGITVEQDKMKKEQTAFESKMRAALGRNVERVAKSSRRSNRRINRFYEMMALPEPFDDNSEDQEESDDDTAQIISDCSQVATQTKKSDEQNSEKTSESFVVSPRQVTRPSNTPDANSKAETRQELPQVKPTPCKPIDDGTDARTNAVIQSPVFVAFRQHVLNDISERIAAARSTQSSDIDIELLAMRNDIRQRVTSTRVVELIKQYTDTETPARVTALARQVAELSDEKVSIPDLNDGLRSKADVQLLETKANVEYVDKVMKDVRERQDTLQSDVNLLIADRREYRDVVQQLLIQQQRLQAAVGNGGATSRAAGGSTSALPLLNTDVHTRRNLITEALTENGSTSPLHQLVADGSPSRAARSAADSNGFAPRPLTELISPRATGGPITGSVANAPPHPLPLLHKPQPPPGSIGLTASQAQYVQFANSEGVSSPKGPRAPNVSNSASLSATRAATESKAPIAYKQLSTVTSPRR